jgi:uroporphyrin-III C-methyltransferase
MAGTVYLVGAGPGAPDLLTLRAARILADADIVLYDALVHPGTLALATRAEKVAVGKRSGKHSTAQRFINKRLLDAARAHQVVVRLKGGDPMIFGRASEEIGYLEREGVRVEVVPGITAALAASAELRIPLTARGVARSVTFVTPRVGEGERPSNWVQAVLNADTAAIYMGGGELPSICAALVAAGLAPATPLALVESASSPDMRVRYIRLDAAQGIELRAPGLILLGEMYRDAADQVARGGFAASQSA